MEEKIYRRRNYIINKSFQFRYVGLILSILFITVLSVAFTTFYIVWNNVLDELAFGVKCPEVNIALGGIITKTTLLLIVPTFLLMGIFAIVGILFSHKIAGPLYRVQKVTEDISNGKLNVNVKFRNSDNMDELAVALNSMIKGLREIVTDDKEAVGKLVKIVGGLKAGVKKNKSMKKDVKDTIIKLDKIASELKKSSNKFKL